MDQPADREASAVNPASELATTRPTADTVALRESLLSDLNERIVSVTCSFLRALSNGAIKWINGPLDVSRGGLETPSDSTQQNSGEYTYTSNQRSAQGDNPSAWGVGVAFNSGQSASWSNLSLVSSIDSALVSITSLASSHGTSSLASSHGILNFALARKYHSAWFTSLCSTHP